MTRIVAGSAKGRVLAVPAKGTRPTSERVREALFSRLDHWGALEGAHVLDLYAGTGALALEALSRGAASADLVEKSAAAARLAARNASACGASNGQCDGTAMATGLAPCAPTSKASAPTRASAGKAPATTNCVGAFRLAR